MNKPTVKQIIDKAFKECYEIHGFKIGMVLNTWQDSTTADGRDSAHLTESHVEGIFYDVTEKQK